MNGTTWTFASWSDGGAAIHNIATPATNTTFRATYTSTNASAQITNPTPGSTFTSSTVTFTWTAGLGVSAYWLTVGTSQGGTEIYPGFQVTGLSLTVSGLPANGSSLYVRLWSLIGGVWHYEDYTYTAASSGSAKAVMTAPAPGSILTSSTVTFVWTTGTAVSQYWLSIGATPGGNQIYDQSQGTNLSVAVSGVPTDGTTLYVRLWSLIAGVWQWNDYIYTAAN